jgi:two-component sensor histidine kinase
MSVATLQQQLAVTGGDDVRLRPYFTDLCASIGASMIHDQSRIALVVDADDCITTANTSISLGLLVTELVINSLKHAFPGDRRGRINVDYHVQGADWALSVADTGIGMPKMLDGAKAGLGTSIVQAIARQLDAEVAVTDGDPGTTVCIAHNHDLANAAPTKQAV